MKISEAIKYWQDNTDRRYRKAGIEPLLSSIFSVCLSYTGNDAVATVKAVRAANGSIGIFLKVSLAQDNPYLISLPPTEATNAKAPLFSSADYWAKVDSEDLKYPYWDHNVNRELVIKLIEFAPAVNRKLRTWTVFAPYTGMDADSYLNTAKSGPALTEGEDYQYEDYVKPLVKQLEQESINKLFAVRMLDNLVASYGKNTVKDLLGVAEFAFPDDIFRARLLDAHQDLFVGITNL